MLEQLGNKEVAEIQEKGNAGATRAAIDVFPTGPSSAQETEAKILLWGTDGGLKYIVPGVWPVIIGGGGLRLCQNENGLGGPWALGPPRDILVEIWNRSLLTSRIQVPLRPCSPRKLDWALESDTPAFKHYHRLSVSLSHSLLICKMSKIGPNCQGGC